MDLIRERSQEQLNSFEISKINALKLAEAMQSAENNTSKDLKNIFNKSHEYNK